MFVAVGGFVVVACTTSSSSAAAATARPGSRSAERCLPLLTGYFAVAERVTDEAVAAAGFAALLSLAQNISPHEVRRRAGGSPP